MYKLDLESMSDAAIAATIGERIEQLRLERNISQKQIALEVGISEVTYRQAVAGKAKLEVVIAILRVIGKLDRLESLVRERPLSPAAVFKFQGRLRKRAYVDPNTQASVTRKLANKRKKDTSW